MASPTPPFPAVRSQPGSRREVLASDPGATAKSPRTTRKEHREQLQEQLQETKKAARNRGPKRDQRRDRLLRAGHQQLESRGYDRMTITALTRQAGMSVGAFYTRFRSKAAFVDTLITRAFNEAQDRLEPLQKEGVWRRKSNHDVIRALVELVVDALARRSPGTVRAAFKRAHVAPGALEPLHAYRKAVTDTALMLLAPRLHHLARRQAVRMTIQILHATILDACLCRERVQSPTSPIMRDHFVRMIQQSLSQKGHQTLK